MLFLYHGTTSTCSLKVRLALSEKALAWDGEILNLQRGDQNEPDYVKLNPNHVVPTLVHDGKVVIESTVILEYLDETFPDVALMPADTYQRAQARLWMKKIDDYLHSACNAVTFSTAFRHLMSKKTPQERAEHLARISNPAKRERTQRGIEEGLAAAHATLGLKQYDKHIAEMEDALAHGRYLTGQDYSLADAATTPYLNRADMVGLDRLWVGRRPRVTEWLERVRARPSFADAVTRYMTDADRARFTVPREQVWNDAKSILNI